VSDVRDGWARITWVYSPRYSPASEQAASQLAKSTACWYEGAGQSAGSTSEHLWEYTAFSVVGD